MTLEISDAQKSIKCISGQRFGSLHSACVDPHGRRARGFLKTTSVSLIPHMKFAKLLAEAGQGDPRHAENLQLRYKQLKKHLKILSSLQGWHLASVLQCLRHDLASPVQLVPSVLCCCRCCRDRCGGGSRQRFARSGKRRGGKAEFLQVARLVPCCSSFGAVPPNWT